MPGFERPFVLTYSLDRVSLLLKPSQLLLENRLLIVSRSAISSNHATFALFFNSACVTGVTQQPLSAWYQASDFNHLEPTTSICPACRYYPSGRGAAPGSVPCGVLEMTRSSSIGELARLDIACHVIGVDGSVRAATLLSPPSGTPGARPRA
jgi:hypothetical protein